jgi:hypothetical protein
MEHHPHKVFVGRIDKLQIERSCLVLQRCKLHTPSPIPYKHLTTDEMLSLVTNHTLNRILRALQVHNK